MRIPIDPPKKRPLTPNEERVYKLLCEGTEPFEIARKLHLGFRGDYGSVADKNSRDSVIGLITSIREKGWEVPENRSENKNEEETEVNENKGGRTPVSAEAVKRMREMYTEEGKSRTEIIAETGISHVTVDKYLKGLTKGKREEPAAVAAVTDSEKENILENIPEPIISEPAPVVKSRAGISSEAAQERRMQKRLERRKLEENIIFLYRAVQELREKMKQLDKELIAIERELAELEGGTDDGSRKKV